MTHNIYTAQQLQRKSLNQLKVIYSQLGSAVEVTDKRYKKSWINAIISHQSTQLQKVDEQDITQAELNQHIAEQAEAIAPEALRVVDISFYDKEYYAGDKLIATITHDHADFVMQRWVVMINNAEEFRAATPMICHRFICTHYKDGTLPKQEQDATETPCTTGNEIMSQIFDACEQHGLELLEDGIYQEDVKLGEVGCTDGNWWVIRTSQAHQGRVICGSVVEAVRLLLMVEVVPYEELLDKAFDELTADEWLMVMESEPVRELVAA